MTGAWGIDFGAFTAAISQRLREDDAERQEIIRALRLCAHVLNGGAKAAVYRGPGADGEDGD